jgi:glutathione S-transferase
LWRITRHSFLYPREKRSAADIELAAEDFLTSARVLEQHMFGRQYVVGDGFTAADCMTAHVIDWAADKKLLSQLPQLHAYVSRLHLRINAPPDFDEARTRFVASNK